MKHAAVSANIFRVKEASALFLVRSQFITIPIEIPSDIKVESITVQRLRA